MDEVKSGRVPCITLNAKFSKNEKRRKIIFTNLGFSMGIWEFDWKQNRVNALALRSLAFPLWNP